MAVDVPQPHEAGCSCPECRELVERWAETPAEDRD